MIKYNEQNERAKREFFQLLKHAKGKSDTTIDGIRKAIQRYEEYTGFKCFATINRDQVIAFKEYLFKQKNERTGKLLSKATLLTTLNNISAFFEWLVIHPEYRRKVDITAISYLTMTGNDKRTAKAGVLCKPMNFLPFVCVLASVLKTFHNNLNIAPVSFIAGKRANPDRVKQC